MMNEEEPTRLERLEEIITRVRALKLEKNDLENLLLTTRSQFDNQINELQEKITENDNELIALENKIKELELELEIERDGGRKSRKRKSRKRKSKKRKSKKRKSKKRKSS
jgi:hypothetical protein